MPPPSRFSLEEEVGQCLLGGFEGKGPSRSLLERIRAGRLGGVILFSRNLESAEQLLSLTLTLQEAAAGSRPTGARRPLPLLVAIDEEGGAVSRLSAEFTHFPPAALFGRAGEAAFARQAAAATARELRAAGVNVNLAPVLDLATNPACTVIGERSYGADPGAVARLGVAAVAGLQAGGVASVVKHFPGHGEAEVDPHRALPRVGTPARLLRERELLPFREALDPRLPAGGAAGVMVAHAVYEDLDSGRPASLSAAIIGDWLRQELGFRGLVVTDDLEMGAIADAAEGARLALTAGADVALLSASEEKQEAAFETLLAAARSGELPAARLDRAARKVAALKARYCEPLERALATREEKRAALAKVVGCGEHRSLREAVLRAAGGHAAPGGGPQAAGRLGTPGREPAPPGSPGQPGL
ncbi:MAG: beta-N-acetylhexosaminidase [Nitrospinota bacterium]